jgi:uncharacterized protein
MLTHTLELSPTSPGQALSLTALHFGTPGRGPKAAIQAALHADEVPAMLVAHHLRELLAAEEAAGRIAGEVVLVPYANPIGLAQTFLGQHVGRFDLRDGGNFNRGVPDLGAAAIAALKGRLGNDAAGNVSLVREALRDAAAALTAGDAAAALKSQLLKLAVDADIVLDLHCDGEAVMHLYALTPQADIAAELGALLGAHAVLLATESGDSPFDEACSRPWLQVQQAYPAVPVPLACFATTVELRGEADTRHETARQDAQAIVAFLRRRGVIAGPAGAIPALRCEPTPLAGSEPVTAPVAGVVVFHQALGAHVKAGDAIADIVCPESARVHTLHARSAGVLYARCSTRWAHAGKRIAKIAGTEALRTGKLLSP